MTLKKVHIRANTTDDAEIYVDGVKQEDVVGYETGHSVGEFPTLALRFIVDEVVVEGEAEVHVLGKEE